MCVCVCVRACVRACACVCVCVCVCARVRACVFFISSLCARSCLCTRVWARSRVCMYSTMRSVKMFIKFCVSFACLSSIDLYMGACALHFFFMLQNALSLRKHSVDSLLFIITIISGVFYCVFCAVKLNIQNGHRKQKTKNNKTTTKTSRKTQCVIGIFLKGVQQSLALVLIYTLRAQVKENSVVFRSMRCSLQYNQLVRRNIKVAQ